MRHGSLFSGIGGFDLASEWMGWENIFHCEWNDFGKRILKYYWPNSKSYDDITKTDFSIHRGSIDILTGGFPCQPYSVAGLRKGKDDERHLWPEMLRAIREIQPTWIVGENVLGLVSWNGGMVFEEVQTDLEAQGYEVQPFILPAAAINAPHKRERVWFIAYRNSGEQNTIRKDNGSNSREKTEVSWTENNSSILERNGLQGNAPYASGFRSSNNGINREHKETRSNRNKRPEELCKIERTDATNSNSRRQPGEEHRKEKSGWSSKEGISNYWQNFPTQSPICDGDDGISSRLDGITFPKWRNESIKGGGNAIVPQVAFNIFKAIQEYKSIIKVTKL